MDQKINHARFKTLLFVLFFILLLVNTFGRTQFTELFGIGEISINLSLLFMFLVFVKSWISPYQYDVSTWKINLSLFLLIAIYMISFLTSNHMELSEFIKLIFLFLFILGTVRMKWNITHIKIAGYVFGVAIILLFSHWILSGLTIHSFKSIFRNENYLGVLLFSMLYFNILSIKYSKKMERFLFVGILVMNFVLIFASSSRSVVLGIAITILAWIVMKQFKGKFSYLIYFVLFGNLLFVFTYIKLQSTKLGIFLNDISMSLLGKNLYSGRSEIWDGVIHAIIEKPLFGYGVGITASDVTDINLTAHNLYLQLFLEVGAIGFIIFFALIVSIWKVLNKRLNYFVSGWSACFLLGILIYENLELTLFQNNYSIALLQWLIITIGVNFAGNDRFHSR